MIKTGRSTPWQLRSFCLLLFFTSEKPGSVVFTGQSSINLFADSVLLGDILKVSGSHNKLDNLNFSNYETRSNSAVRFYATVEV